MNFYPFQHDLVKGKVIKNLLLQDSGDFLLSNPQLCKEGQRAAVLVPLFYKHNQLHVLLTRRADSLRTAPGEVAFPGGKRDQIDKDDIETAIREAEEEIGLCRKDVQVVSRLPPMFSMNNLIVTPVIGFVPDDCMKKVVINHAEVQEVFSVPVAMFLTKRYHHSEFMNWPGRFEFIHFFQKRRKKSEGPPIPLIFGLTAYICICVACIIYKKDPEFQMERTFHRKDLEIGYISSFAVVCLTSHMDIYQKRRKMFSDILHRPKAKL